MLFNSAIFLFFISILMPLYALIRPTSARKVLLLVASYIFYANWDYRYVPLLALSTLVDYFAGRNIAASDGRGTRRAWLLVSIVTNIGILSVFKYGNFFIETLDPIWNVFSITLPRLPGAIPVGISFYTFQTLSYTIDIYRRRTRPCASLIDFALFVSFFADLVAGPILRSKEFLPQIKTMRDLRFERVAEGFQRFIFGLLKKVVIADNAGLYVTEVFATPGDYSAPTLWFAAAAFAVQIYFDFSGYTDMALGIGHAFGFKFPENFSAPFLARSVTESWRRWHMSLTRWFRDYLYEPLGGATSSRWGISLKLIVTMTLIGLWHGAGWNFVLFGSFFGVVLAIENSLGYGRFYAKPYNTTLGEWLRTLLNVVFWLVGAVLFRFQGLANMGVHLTRMFSAWSWDGRPEMRGLNWLGALGAVMVFEHLVRVYRARETVWERLPPVIQGLALATAIVLIAFYRVDEVAFIYFQF